MKELIIIFISLFISEIVSDWIHSLVGLDYNWFTDKFDLLLLLADFSIFLVIYVPIYLILKRLINRKGN
ncbi:hypothetical protein LG329_17000 [Virgibacillus necropolis]|uniref:hypothetical protein n=1 Tax=Virgibacillus necropolis TaxID=163877 RepID=UPI00384C1A43